MANEVPICTHCWIPVKKEVDGKPIVGGEQAPRWVHESPRSATGNPFCGRAFLEDEDIEYVSAVDEA